MLILYKKANVIQKVNFGGILVYFYYANDFGIFNYHLYELQ